MISAAQLLKSSEGYTIFGATTQERSVLITAVYMLWQEVGILRSSWEMRVLAGERKISNESFKKKAENKKTKLAVMNTTLSDINKDKHPCNLRSARSFLLASLLCVSEDCTHVCVCECVYVCMCAWGCGRCQEQWKIVLLPPLPQTCPDIIVFSLFEKKSR